MRDKDDESCSSSDNEGINDTASGPDDALMHPNNPPSSFVDQKESNDSALFSEHVSADMQQQSHINSSMTWEQAHRMACLKNGSLQATRLQIESQFPIGQEISIPDSSLLVWSEPLIVDQLATLIKPNILRLQQPSESYSSSSSFLWNAVRGIWAFAQPRHSNDEDDEDDEESDAEESQQEETTTTDLHWGLVHPTMARSVLGYLASMVQTNSEAIIPLSSPSVWKKWILQQEKADYQELLCSLPVSELQVIFQALERSGVPVSVHTTPSKELVLVTGTSSSSLDNQDVSTRLVEYDLHQTALRLEQEHLALEEQSKKYRAAALAAKKRFGNPIPSMKLYKLCEAQMTHKQNHLLQIETVRMALRQAVNNRSVVQAMGSARTMLRDIHNELENVHDVMDDLKESMQDHEEVNTALQSNFMVETDDEDELLQELQKLCLDVVVVVDEDKPKDRESNTTEGDKPIQLASTEVPVAPDTKIESTNSATDEIEATDDASLARSSRVRISV